MLPSPARARRACPLPGQGEGSGKAAKGKTLPADSFTRCAFDFTLVYSHQYFFGLAIPAGESTVYSTTSTPSAVSFPDQVSVSVSSSLTRPRSCRYSSSRRTCICERPIFTSCSTRQTMVSLTPIGRPASSTRSIRQRASSRCFCSRSAPLGILILSVARCPSVILERNEGHPPFRGRIPRPSARVTKVATLRLVSPGDFILQLPQLTAHLGAHRVELGLERIRETDPILAAYIVERQFGAEPEQVLFDFDRPGSDMLEPGSIFATHAVVTVE